MLAASILGSDGNVEGYQSGNGETVMIADIRDTLLLTASFLTIALIVVMYWP